MQNGLLPFGNRPFFTLFFKLANYFTINRAIPQGFFLFSTYPRQITQKPHRYPPGR